MHNLHFIYAAALKNAVGTVASAILPTATAYSTAYVLSYIYEPLANHASEYAEEYELYEYKTAASENMYNLITTNLGSEIADFSSLLTNNFLSSLKNAMLLDGIVFYVLGGQILPGIIGATIAYDLRTSINSYFENSKSYEVMGGVFAGAIKYGIAGLTLDKKVLFVGAINNAAYEYFKTADDDPVTNNDVIGLYTSLFQIEGIDAALNIILREKGKLEQFTTTLKVAGLLSASVWGFLTAEDKPFYCDNTKCYKKDVLVHNITYIDERYKGDYDFTLKRVLNHVNKIGSDISYLMNMVNSQKPTSDDLENKEIIMNTTLHYNPKTQCALKDSKLLDIRTIYEHHDELSQNTELNNEEAQQSIKEDL